MYKNQTSQSLCTLGYNHNKQILMICLNKQCDASRLCCLTCIDEFHRKHQLISLYKFEEMLSQLDEKLKPHAKNDVINIVKQYQLKVNQVYTFVYYCLQDLEESLKRAVSQYNNSKKQIDLVFKEVFQMIQFQKSQKSVKEAFYAQFTSKNVNFYLKKISQTKNNSYETSESALATLKKSQNILKTQIKDFEVGFTKLMEGFTKNINNIKTALTQSSFIPFSKRFSKINKALCLEINENQSTTKRIEGTGGYPINLLESPLTKQNNQVNIKILEQPDKKGIWMGIAILDIVKNNNFQSCYGIGKGTYAIDQVGATHGSAYSWNHHDSNYNSQPKVGWQFNLGDTVNIKVDFTYSFVTYTRGFDQYTQPIRLDLGDIYAFAGPTNLNDCLQIF